jgi:addiction module RelE/StbE family toxin
MKRIEWLTSAKNDLIEIGDYLRRFNLRAARNVPMSIFKRANAILGENPEIARAGRVKGTRELFIEPHFLVVYYVQPRDKKVFIINVIHTSRDYPKAVK